MKAEKIKRYTLPWIIIIFGNFIFSKINLHTTFYKILKKTCSLTNLYLYNEPTHIVFITMTQCQSIIRGKNLKIRHSCPQPQESQSKITKPEYHYKTLQKEKKKKEIIKRTKQNPLLILHITEQPLGFSSLNMDMVLASCW